MTSSEPIPQREKSISLPGITSSPNNPVIVSSVQVHGTKYTSHSLLTSVTEPLLEAQTLNDVLIGSNVVGERLLKLGIFESVSVELDSSRPSPRNTSEFTDVNIIYHVKEKKRIHAKSQVSAGNYEGSMGISFSLNNAFGNAESISAEMTSGVSLGSGSSSGVGVGLRSSPSTPTPTHNSYNLHFSKPFISDPDASFIVHAFQDQKDDSFFLSFKERLTGLTTSLKRSFWHGVGLQEVSYHAIWRENHSLSNDASMSIREEAGHSLKSSLSHTLSLDARDDPVLPSSGLYFRTFQELAGIGGDTRYVKSDFDIQKIFSLTQLAVMHPSGGFIQSLHPTSSHIRINDRFFLGGPLSIRGFRQFGIGPRDGYDALGGTAYLAGSMGLQFPLPFLEWKVLKAHLFVNGGSLIQTTKDDSANSILTRLSSSPSIAWGIGLTCKFTQLRLELNYMFPLTVTTSDVLNPRFQFGIGMHFM